MSQGWGGRSVTRQRRVWAARLPLPCACRCGTTINPGDAFDLEHDPPRALGGTRVVGVIVPAHNRAAGARLGNALRTRAGRLGKVDRTW